MESRFIELWKVDLLNYVEEDFVNSIHDMSRDASTLHFITSALAQNILFSILHEYGKIQNAKNIVGYFRNEVQFE